MKRLVKSLVSTTPNENPLSTNQATAGILVAALGLILYVSLFVITCLRTPGEEKYLQLCILNVGVACGWLLGIMASPDDEEEQSRFSRFGTTAGTFFSGYVLSKLNFESLLAPSFWTPGVAFRLLLFFGGLLIAALVTYSLREYILPSPDAATSALITEKHEFDVAPGTIGVLDCCSDLPDAARLRLQVLASDGPLYVTRTDAATGALDEGSFPRHLLMRNHNFLEIMASEAGAKGRRLALHNTGTKAARVSISVLGTRSKASPG